MHKFGEGTIQPQIQNSPRFLGWLDSVVPLRVKVKIPSPSQEPPGPLLHVHDLVPSRSPVK